MDWPEPCLSSGPDIITNHKIKLHTMHYTSHFINHIRKLPYKKIFKHEKASTATNFRLQTNIKEISTPLWVRQIDNPLLIAANKTPSLYVD